MEMTDHEIVESYKEAKNKLTQIRTLAELNACDPQKIREILMSAGYEEKELHPKNWGKKQKKPEAEAEETATIAIRQGAVGKIGYDRAALVAALENEYKEITDEISKRVADADALFNAIRVLKGEKT